VTAATELAFGRMRQDARLRILLVEDDANDAELVQACLAEAVRAGAELLRAASLAEALRVLETQAVHITVLDLDLPDSAGFATLEKAGAAARGPVIVVTGNPHPALVSEALARGAYEVLRKNELDARSLMRVVRLASLQSQTEGALRLTERRYRALIEDSREAIGLFGSSGELLYGNPAMRRLLWSGSNLIELAHPFERDAVEADYRRLAGTPGGRVTLKAHFRPLSQVGRVDVQTAVPAAFLRECLLEAVEPLQGLAENAKRLSAIYRGHDLTEGHTGLKALAAELAAAAVLADMLSGPIGIDLQSLTNEGVTAAQQLQQLEATVDALVSAQEAQDWLTVADLLEYDLEPAVRKWAGLLTLLACRLQ
jgi:CheY-like chemotaxis protein